MPTASLDPFTDPQQALAGDRSILVRALPATPAGGGPASEELPAAGYTLVRAVRRMSPERASLLLLSLVEQRVPMGLDLNERALREVLGELRELSTLEPVAEHIRTAARDNWSRDLDLVEKGRYAGGRFHRRTYPYLKLAGLLEAFRDKHEDGIRNLSGIPSSYGALLPLHGRMNRLLSAGGRIPIDPAASTADATPQVRRAVGQILFASGVSEIVGVLRAIWSRPKADLREIIDDALDDRLRVFLAEVYGSQDHRVGPYGKGAPDQLRSAIAEAVGLLAAPGPSGVSQVDAIMGFLTHLYEGRSLDSVRLDKVREILADENPGTLIIRGG